MRAVKSERMLRSTFNVLLQWTPWLWVLRHCVTGNQISSSYFWQGVTIRDSPVGWNEQMLPWRNYLVLVSVRNFPNQNYQWHLIMLIFSNKQVFIIELHHYERLTSHYRLSWIKGFFSVSLFCIFELESECHWEFPRGIQSYHFSHLLLGALPRGFVRRMHVFTEFRMV